MRPSACDGFLFLLRHSFFVRTLTSPCHTEQEKEETFYRTIRQSVLMDNLSPLILFIYRFFYFHDLLSIFVCPHESVLSFLHNYSPLNIIKKSCSNAITPPPRLHGGPPDVFQYTGAKGRDSVHVVMAIRSFFRRFHCGLFFSFTSRCYRSTFYKLTGTNIVTYRNI
ncbi:hypothetical protein CPB86DRAFT_610355 [Serendipita vermifera]|nr:hypothetical protein CPB86DRAFT_610355 [Serendipita vermifera]